jgi:hypothetical protein
VAGTAWRVREKTTGRTRAAARERRVGAARSRRWHRSSCNDGEQWRRAVRAGGRAAWQGEERPARSGERRAGCGNSTWREERRRGGGGCTAHGRRGWRGVGQRNRGGEGLEVDEGELSAIFQKCRDSTIKPG